MLANAKGPKQGDPGSCLVIQYIYTTDDTSCANLSSIFLNRKQDYFEFKFRSEIHIKRQTNTRKINYKYNLNNKQTRLIKENILCEKKLALLTLIIKVCYSLK